MKTSTDVIYSVKFWLVVIVLVGGFLRFQKLDWGGGFFFHPDERNIASSISSLRFPGNMNPGFFAYGSFPIYLNFFLQKLLGRFGIFLGDSSFSEAIMLGRLLSAVTSTANILFAYVVGKRLFSERVGIFCAFLTTVTVGFIQYAHFATFETFLAFLYLLLFFVSAGVIKRNGLTDWLALGLVFGFSVSIKITSLLLAGVYPFVLYRVLQRCISKRRILRTIFSAILSLFLAALIFIVTNPYSLLDFSSFRTAITVESGIARGIIPIFYTQQFSDTPAFLFYFLRVFPWIGGLGLTLLLPFSVIWGCWLWKRGQAIVGLLLVLLLPHFVFNSFLFVKWTRYMIPLLPFFLVLVSLMLDRIILFRPHRFFWSLQIGFVSVVIALSVLWAFAFEQIYTGSDPRVAASVWAERHLGQSSKILSETYDLGVLPFNDRFAQNITLFNFYDLAALPTTDERLQQLATLLEKSDYIILPSRRVWKNTFDHPQRYPLRYSFYSTLFDGSLGFTKIKEFSSPPKLLGYTIDDNAAEETFQVFDHPTLVIFKKQLSMTADVYGSLIRNLKPPLTSEKND